MRKTFTAILLALSVLGLSGCFPVFVPVGDHHHHHHDRGYHRGR